MSSTPILEIPELQESLCALIKSFFQRWTHDQCVLLLSGTMDGETTPLLRRLISSIIDHLSEALEARVIEMDAEVTENLVAHCLGNVVANSLKSALNIRARGQSRSAGTLRDMIAQEVMVSVQCSMSDTLVAHVPAPERLDGMVKVAAKMLRCLRKKLYLKYLDRAENEAEDPQEDNYYIADVEDILVEVIRAPSAKEAKAAVFSAEQLREKGVLLVVQRLVSRAYSKSKVTHLSDLASITEHLMESTWAAVRDVDFDYSPQIVADLEKTIFKALVKMWGAEVIVLSHMKNGSQALKEFVGNAVRAHLSAQPKKRRAVYRFFSSVGQSFAQIGRRGRGELRAIRERVQGRA